jgi:glycosyltransferase involved in cell wall biosynthesis
MRIVFDATTLTPQRTGVGYYAEHLLQHLAREVERSGDELWAISNRPLETTAPLPPHVRVHTARRFPLRIAWLQLVAPRLLAELRPDVAHFTNAMLPLATPCPTVVTVHDMSLELHPRCHPLRRLLVNRPLAALALRRASLVVTVSESARADLLRLRPLPAERVRVVPEAAAPLFRPVREQHRLARVRERHALPERFLLYVGTIEPRKNLDRLMEALALARGDGAGVELVCVGPYGWSARDLAGRVERLGLGSAVRFTGYVPAAELPALYSLAQAFVFPSIYEGFGLPVVEAMACGTPVVTANNSSLAEIAGDAALTVDPHDVAALAAAILRVSGDAELRRTLAERGLRRAAEFSWERSAREMLAAYRHAAGLAQQPSLAAVREMDARSASQGV